MAKSFEDLMKKTCSKDVIIDGYKRTMNYFAEYIGLTEHKDEPKTIKIFKPYSITTKTVSHYSPPKRRDPSRRWK
jgi:hypothetical protein